MINAPARTSSTGVYIDMGCGFADGVLPLIDMHALSSWSTQTPAAHHES